ncbi:MAG TPA: PIN domain-containing protein [Candidatus Nanoarchaeia archaeon]|nr:PIN domain-containing protein [Candidatus Nanoarchaeia archaeon]
MILLDSSFVVAYYNELDDHHSRALILMKDIINGSYGEVCISDYVFDESVTVLLLRLKDIAHVGRLGESLQKLRLFFLTDSLFRSTWEIFKRQTNGLSFTDCSLIALMRMESISYLATFDEAFDMFKDIEVIS